MARSLELKITLNTRECINLFLEQFFPYAYQWLELKLYDCLDIYMLGTTEEVNADSKFRNVHVVH
jgi:hypothetical protein